MPTTPRCSVQNRVSQALARLPEDVRRQGVTTQKQSPAFLMVVHLVSPDGKYDSLYLRNYCACTSRTSWRACPASAMRRLFGGGDYAMRIWLDPDKIASRGLTAGDVRARGARAERAGLRRPARRRADAQRQRLPASRSTPRAACSTRRGVRRHRAQDRRRRRDRAPVRRRAHRTRRRRLHAARAPRRQERRRDRHLPGARRQRAGRSATR